VRHSAVAAFTALALLAFVVAGCGGGSGSGGVPDAEETAPENASVGNDKVVMGSVELERAPGGPPDAGTQTGHRGGEASGGTNRPTFRFDGIVSPAGSEVTIASADDALGGRVRMVGDHGDFTVELSNLLRGRNRFTLRATARGYKPWTQAVVISRRPRGR
jgi:hypothetical protein